MQTFKIVMAVLFGIAAFGNMTTLFLSPVGEGDTGTVIGAALSLIIMVVLIVNITETNKKRKQQGMIAANDRARLQNRLAEVERMTVLPVVQYPYSILLRPMETCYYQAEASTLVVKNQVVGHTANSSGVSVRVAKGVTLHSGGSRGHSIRGNVAYTYPGLFTMTNQRFVMTGEKGFEHPIEKVTSITPYNGFEGITFQFGRSSYTLLMREPFIIPKIIDLINAERIQRNAEQ